MAMAASAFSDTSFFFTLTGRMTMNKKTTAGMIDGINPAADGVFAGVADSSLQDGCGGNT